MSFARRPVPRASGAAAAVAAVAVMTLAVPAAPASAGGAACTLGRFTATSQADLAKITVLDPGLPAPGLPARGPLAPGLPALTDVRLAPAHGLVDTRNRAGKTAATAGYADAKLLGMNLPGLPLPNAVADHQAPGRRPGPVTVSPAALNAGGLATAELAKATAEATWDDRYHCGKTGPLTRAATMIEGLNVLGGSGTGPAIQAVSALTHLGHPASLLRLGPTGSAQSATDLVKLGGGRIGVRAGAGITLSDLTLFAGTPHEITAKVINQPTLEVVAGGDRRHSTVTYRPATLTVTSAGKPVTGLDSDHTSVSVSLPGRIAAERPASPLDVRLSLGEPTRKITDAGAWAEAAALRVEVTLGSSRLLDVAIGHLSVGATAPCRVGAETPRHQAGPPTGTDQQQPADRQPPADQPGAGSPVDVVDREVPAAGAGHTVPTNPAAGRDATSGPLAVGATPASGTPSSGGGLALTGANAAVIGLGGLTMIVVGLTALYVTRRRRAVR